VLRPVALLAREVAELGELTLVVEIRDGGAEEGLVT
jgi:hypothetical protein